MNRIPYALILLANIVAAYSVGRYTAVEIAMNPKGSEMRVSAYCACPRCCGKYSDGITASGHVIQPGDRFCAAPKSIPFGTILEIPGYGRAEVLDRGGAIGEGRLDVFFPTHQAALEWGVKTVKVRRCDD